MRRSRSLTAVSAAVILVLAPFLGAIISAPNAGAANVTAPGAIQLGDSVSGSITDPNLADQYTLSIAASGTRAYFQRATNNCNCSWSLTGPNGTVFSQNIDTGDVGPTTLIAGAYVLTIASDGTHTGSYSFALSAVPSPQTFAIAVGDTVSDGNPSAGAGNIEAPGAVDRYTFSIGGGGTRVYLHALGGTCSCSWSLRSSDGNLANGFGIQGIGEVGPVQLPADSYVLTVTGGGGNTGTYSFELSAVPAPQTFAIGVGDTVSDGLPSTGAGNIEVLGAVDRYTFSVGGSGTNVYLQNLTDSCGCTWSLRSSDGSLASGFAAQGLFDVGPFNLPASSYVLTVAGGTGTYSFELWSVPNPQTFAITLGDTIADGDPSPGAGNIESPGAIDRYTFAASAGDRIEIVGIGGCAASPTYVLSAPSGRQLVQSGACNADVVLDLPNETGQYQLTVGGDDNVGAYSLQVASTVADTNVTLNPAQVFAISVGDTVSLDDPATGAGNIESLGTVDDYTFSGTAGQAIHLDDVSDTGSLYWTLYGPDGTALGQSYLYNTYSRQFALPQTGTYEIEVTGFGSYTGTYSFSVINAPAPQVFAISPGDTVSADMPASGAGNIEQIGSDDEYAFTGTAGQTIRFNDLGSISCCDLYWVLYAPDGTALGQNWLGDSPGVQLTLPTSGQYTIRVNDYDDYYYYYYYYGLGTGTYSFSLTNVPDAQVFPISIGDSVADGVPATGAGNIEQPGSDDEYAFTGTAGQTIRFNDANISCCTLYWALYAPDGTALGQNWLGNSTGQQVTLPATGQYTIRVNDSQYYSYDTATGTYAFSVTQVPLLVPSVTAPITPFISAGQNAVWTVGIQNTTAVPLHNASATFHAFANGGTPLAFDGTAMTGCSAGAGNSEVCPVGDIPANSTKLLSVFVKTDGLTGGTPVTGDVTTSATGVDDATGVLGAVTIASCGVSCVLAVAAPGVAVSSISGPPTAATPTKQVLLLPATQAGGAPPAIPVKIQSITPTAAETAADKKLCPVATGQTHCSGQISGVTAKFAKFTDAAHPIRVTVVARWGSTVPSGHILMEKDTGGDPLFLIACALNPTTHQYNTPCVLSETVSGTAQNRITTSIVLFNGVDIHFARRVSTGGTVIKAPAAPTAVSVIPGPLKATLKWNAPAATNGAGVTTYVVTVLSAGKVVKTVSFASPALTQAISGLVNGKSYTFKVAAKNVAGVGAASAASAATIVGAPGAPTAVAATRSSSGSLRVSFTAPPTNGASISSYTATCTSTNAGVTKTKVGTAGPLTVIGLTPAKTYKCTVKATNSRGTGPPSAASAAVIA